MRQSILKIFIPSHVEQASFLIGLVRQLQFSIGIWTGNGNFLFILLTQHFCKVKRGSVARFFT
ncbi:hypothetical protein CON37_26115 [Bacillus cereus]|nr:hypothetical protein CON37_26115 [Bacillus cereus]